MQFVFVATDARPDDNEFNTILASSLPIVMFPTGRMAGHHPDRRLSTGDGLCDGERAIVEQLLCVSADLFVGSVSSLYTARIREERCVR